MGRKQVLNPGGHSTLSLWCGPLQIFRKWSGTLSRRKARKVPPFGCTKPSCRGRGSSRVLGMRFRRRCDAGALVCLAGKVCHGVWIGWLVLPSFGCSDKHRGLCTLVSGKKMMWRSVLGFVWGGICLVGVGCPRFWLKRRFWLRRSFCFRWTSQCSLRHRVPLRSSSTLFAHCFPVAVCH